MNDKRRGHEIKVNEERSHNSGFVCVESEIRITGEEPQF